MPTALDLYASTARPNTAKIVTVAMVEDNQQVGNDKNDKGFDARHILTSEGSFVAQPPVNHTLDNAVFIKTKK